LPKPSKQKVAVEIKDMQMEIENLQKALAQLVEALIQEEKPGFKEIKKLTELRNEALAVKPATVKAIKSTSPKRKKIAPDANKKPK
jgi:hypothetical protein